MNITKGGNPLKDKIHNPDIKLSLNINLINKKHRIKKYTNIYIHIYPKQIAIIIQPEWVIDEAPKTLRTQVWLNPNTEPIKALKNPKIINKKGVSESLDTTRFIKPKGAIFKGPNNSILENHDSPWVTEVTQKWPGNNPIFRLILIKNI